MAFEEEFGIEIPGRGRRAAPDRGRRREVSEGEGRRLDSMAVADEVHDGNAQRQARRRVVVTGMGLLTPVGNDVRAAWDALLAGTQRRGPITQFEATEDFDCRFAAEVKDFRVGGLPRPQGGEADGSLHAVRHGRVAAGGAAGGPGGDAGRRGLRPGRRHHRQRHRRHRTRSRSRRACWSSAGRSGSVRSSCRCSSRTSRRATCPCATACAARTTARCRRARRARTPSATRSASSSAARRT
jgi:hypothetical protein